MLKTISLSTAFSPLLSLALFVTQAQAGGYELQGHSAKGVGFSSAGAVSGYDDGSAAYYNPAALAIHDKSVFTLGSHYIPFSIDFEDRGSTVAGMPNQGADSGERPVDGYIPNLYYVEPLNEKLTGALFVTTPYGLSSRYRSDWVGRYQAVNSTLMTVQTGLAASYEVTPSFSLGGSVSAIYGDAKLSNAIDFGTIGYSALGPSTATALGLFPQANDGYMKLSGDDTDVNWQVGALYRYGEQNRNRVGVSYRSNSTLRFTGAEADFTVPDSARVLTMGGAFQDTQATAALPLPERVAIGATHWLNDNWALLWESEWNRWSRMGELAVAFENPAQPAAVENMDWRDTWHHAAGVNYAVCPDWSLRAGFQFDRSTIRDASLRSPRIPDSDTFIYGVGTSYQLAENLRFDLSYWHMDWLDSKTNRAGPTGDVLVGEWSNTLEAISAALIWTF